ncbi:phage tail terminator family protein [Cohnella hongkongensis]|uniref:DUF6838 family protein n=1 Tax=Cohnella hongkongensis TaxID=178337 RepID=A0ABV9FLX6_9BACL
MTLQIPEVMKLQVTLNDFRRAVEEALEAAFPDVAIGSEEAEQPNAPYFLVRLSEPSHTQELDRRFRWVLPFVIQYFDPERRIDEMHETAERLMTALNPMNAGGRPVRGIGMKWEIEGDALRFYVTYQLFVWAPHEAVPKMRKLEQNGGIRT